MEREFIDWLPVSSVEAAVLYFLPRNSYTPYATWLVNRESPGDTFWGHYFGTLEAAEADLIKRATRDEYLGDTKGEKRSFQELREAGLSSEEALKLSGRF